MKFTRGAYLFIMIAATMAGFAETHVHASPNAWTMQVAAKKSGAWIGADVAVTVYDLGLSANSNTYVAVPVAITNYASGSAAIFIEVGPIKNCQSGGSCTLRPYFSFVTASYAIGFSEDLNRTHSHGDKRRYKVDKIGPTSFQGIVCDGNGSACGVIVSQDMGVADLPYVFTAVETISDARWFPAIVMSDARVKNTSFSWSNWCYDSTNASHPDLSVSPCVSFGWELRGGYPSFGPFYVKN